MSRWRLYLASVLLATGVTWLIDMPGVLQRLPGVFALAYVPYLIVDEARRKP